MRRHGAFIGDLQQLVLLVCNGFVLSCLSPALDSFTDGTGGDDVTGKHGIA